MLREERLFNILDIISKSGIAKTHYLSKLLSVSESTIRRDLGILQTRKLIFRSRNGSILQPPPGQTTPVHYRATINAKAKDEIARAATSLLRNGSLIFLDSSSTVMSMVNYFSSYKNLTIVTNSLLAAKLLRNSGHHIILTGGEFYAPSNAFYGKIATDTIQRYNYEMCFISCVSITKEGYAAEAQEHSVEVRKEAIRHSAYSVLLCDRSKFDKTCPYNLVPINDFDCLITDDPIRPQNARCRILRVE